MTALALVDEVTTLDGNVPGGPLETKWTKYRDEVKLVNPTNKRKFHVIVVGSGNSSNSVRLVEVALEAGAKAAYRVDDASEIQEAWLDGVSSVSVTSGASVPEDLVEGVLAFLAERGYPDARAVHTAEESLIFALPPELRKDMRAAGVL